MDRGGAAWDGRGFVAETVVWFGLRGGAALPVAWRRSGRAGGDIPADGSASVTMHLRGLGGGGYDLRARALR